MIWKTLIALSVVAIIVGGGVWISHGMHTFTKDREQVVTKVTDELFGTVREEVTWVENFSFGFLPDDTAAIGLYRSYIFVIGASFFTTVVSAYMLRRKKRTTI